MSETCLKIKRNFLNLANADRDSNSGKNVYLDYNLFAMFRAQGSSWQNKREKVATKEKTKSKSLQE